MVTRLEQVHPDIATWLQGLPHDRQVELVHDLATHAVQSTGLSVPPEATDLSEWAADIDSRGWSRDADGQWVQTAEAFAHARAAFALRDASTAGLGSEATKDSLYESIVALGPDFVRTKLGLTT